MTVFFWLFNTVPLLVFLVIGAAVLRLLRKWRRYGNPRPRIEISLAMWMFAVLCRLVTVIAWPAAPVWIVLIPLTIGVLGPNAFLVADLRRHPEILFSERTIARLRALRTRVRPTRP